jgi:type IV pilus assembly protein PilW
MKMNRSNLAPRTIRANRGVGLVEIMVGMVIALASMIVIMQVFSQSEGLKRTATFGGDAQTNGAVALYSFERDARLAGFGLTASGLLDCPSITVWRQSSGVAEQLRFVPFEVNPPVASVMAGDANSDVVTIAFGSADNAVEAIPTSQVANSAANFNPKSRAGFSTGDIVIGTQTVGGVKQCAVHEITNVPGGQCGTPPGGGPDVVIHSTGTYKSFGKGCVETTAEYNRPGGIPGIDALDISNGGKLFNLGALPINLAYAVRDKNLTVCDRMTSNCTIAANFTPIASDIVALRAVYGKDTNNDGAVDTWDRITPANELQWQQVAAARIVIVARSGIKERANAAGVCEQTMDAAKPDNQTWVGQGVPGAEIDVADALDPEWGCYRYKMLQTTVPFRNIIWRP